jgi:hypothetical protein
MRKTKAVSISTKSSYAKPKWNGKGIKTLFICQWDLMFFCNQTKNKIYYLPLESGLNNRNWKCQFLLGNT